MSGEFEKQRGVFHDWTFEAAFDSLVTKRKDLAPCGTPMADMLEVMGS